MPDLLEHIEITPNDEAVACVIWLHGLGADGHDFEPIVPELRLPDSLPIRFIFPHVEKITGIWMVDIRLSFGNEQYLLVVRHRRIERTNRTLGTHEQWVNAVGINRHVA